MIRRNDLRTFEVHPLHGMRGGHWEIGCGMLTPMLSILSRDKTASECHHPKDLVSYTLEGLGLCSTLRKKTLLSLSQIKLNIASNIVIHGALSCLNTVNISCF